MTRVTTFASTVLAIVALSCVPSTASARAGLPWFAQYHASVVTGSEDITWTDDHRPSSACDPAATGQGRDDVTFLSSAPVTFTVHGVGPAAFPAAITGLKLRFVEDRTGRLAVGALPSGCGVGRGGGGGPAPSPDCGVRDGSALVSIQLPRPMASAFTPGPPTSNYQDCPVLPAEPPWFPPVITVKMPRLGPNIDGGAPAATAEITANYPLVGGGLGGDVKLRLLLHLIRQVVFDPMGLPPDLSTLHVTRAGRVSLPLICPPGPSCDGTVSLDTYVLPARDAGFAPASVAPPFPTAVPTQIRPVAQARFALAPGKRRVVLHLASPNLLASQPVQAFQVIVRQRVGRRRVSYWIGWVRLAGAPAALTLAPQRPRPGSGRASVGVAAPAFGGGA